MNVSFIRLVPQQTAERDRRHVSTKRIRHFQESDIRFKAVSKSRRYWIWVLGDVEGLRWILDNRTMAFASHTVNRTTRISEGDRAILYVTRGAFYNPPRDHEYVGGIATVTGEPSMKNVVIADLEFAYQVPFKIELLTPERQGPRVKPLVGTLSFVRKPRVWGGYFRNSPIEVSSEDFEVLAQALRSWHVSRES